MNIVQSRGSTSPASASDVALNQNRCERTIAARQSVRCDARASARGVVDFLQKGDDGVAPQRHRRYVETIVGNSFHFSSERQRGANRSVAERCVKIFMAFMARWTAHRRKIGRMIGDSAGSINNFTLKNPYSAIWVTTLVRDGSHSFWRCKGHLRGQYFVGL